ncbi:2,3,4,5-tetrahydropyridine-2,6-dicarboxylate N-acetyltransferase [Staphylococcus epidermidis]|mgnify:FL=1|jgi:tetrahydrodipicolinate N-acetyltransferase|uniref:2,3,4,5-tetrahydropyridine-2,6-dicarboxylate N-acetyltransferase n=1 Tax=Staphylococcus epidermidis (strain ATCC 12228 / FDA PCI 1200) TaxID=176280 RepID=DAPH_STAES|nr:2,3,4,5-tetrahydropyridine-2,6-dicarboxylate N-acetyltransferase [Staphylococcus epidermidis]Q8CSM7.1 RecName: Full=2,3,4,5-tetrahydropyridine-2,6-dicarboxylate N-acetyltransferase; AltName: Full=Tetrahydrodipicolinate N-acetyltransferase; Short=THP acetyltransferase; Short=Tetrahydropicolinate acetylase [Staphylococcus epidermidis ATCC 12228]EHQ78560.1 2,3,4,5-tetrahydropyridine-2,6-dicarboxylate N-acetyltransferase [Staphylococcus epidermidis VCU057]AAO04674.1 tetrahydrodipicolinate acetylt
MVQHLSAQEIIQYISDAKKSTPLKVYVNGHFENVTFPESFKVFGSEHSKVIFCEANEWKQFYQQNHSLITELEIEMDRRNSAIPLKDLTNTNARIEPGAFIREQAIIEDGAVVMMGATINIGAIVGEGTMIDMNATLGGRATTGKNVHVGAGAVLAGVIEPPSASPVVIEDNVLIGANAVILEGVRVGAGAIVAAGAIVTQDVPAGAVVAGTPAKVIKQTSEVQDSKREIVSALRKLNNE